MIGAKGEKLSLNVVARYADWWNAWFVDSATYKHKLEALIRKCTRIGRNPDEIVKTVFKIVAIADTDEEAKKIAKNHPYGWWAAGDFIGACETVKKNLMKYVDIGVQYFILWFLPFMNQDSSQLFEEEVISEFKQ